MLTALAVVALAGLAAGLLVARGNGASGQVRTGLIATGQFHAVSWGTTGTASIVGRDGHAVLELRDLRTQRAPELWIVLQGTKSVRSRHSLAHLNRAWGNQDYPLPAKAASNPHMRVLIYCAKCGKVSGYAQLSPVGRSA